jgi:L-threonylcarbamoyladenylate synthase
VALRAPNHELALAVVQAVGGPVTATSANRSGGPDPVSAQEVERQLGDDLDLIIDGGRCEVGVSSTIIDCSAPQSTILREGAIAPDVVLRAVAGIS